MDTSNIKTKTYNKRLAVAVALSFANEIKTRASNGKLTINPVKRYFTYTEWTKEYALFLAHTSLSTWLLRFVVSSQAEANELNWARENAGPECLIPQNIGKAARSIVTYTEKNENGVSVHDHETFYDKKPLTLQVLKEYGAVCGGISHFSVGMCQAFGIPACTIGQPGHCAFVWWRNNGWKMSYGNTGLNIVFNDKEFLCSLSLEISRLEYQFFVIF